jgi:hypothetical protein
MKTHELKSWPEFFEPIFKEEKSFEVRKNDRDFKIGDRIMLKEYDPEIGSYTGRYCFRTITYILSENPFIDLKDYVILSLIIDDQFKP